ncbi:MAG: DUF4411 family protein [Armatimonadetes bacterium]|nr:DUF4411 family protein [Armatimonadota bacterium]MDW8121779.1 DUF4411 family protein [Armatimonadota bacterium]
MLQICYPLTLTSYGLCTTHCVNPSRGESTRRLHYRHQRPHRFVEELSPETFPTLWEKIGELATEGRLKAPLRVKEELLAKKNNLARWAQEHGHIFSPDDDALVERCRTVLREVPDLVDYEKEREDADPWVVALALEEREKQQQKLEQLRAEVVVVTQERFGSIGGRRKIPDACRYFSVPCYSGPDSLVRLFQAENWRF